MPSGATAMALLPAQPIATEPSLPQNTGASVDGGDGGTGFCGSHGSVAIAAILSRCTVHKTVRGTQHYAYRSLRL